MIRTFHLAVLATLVVAPVLSLASPARAQIGTIFSNQQPPRPPGGVPSGSNNIQDPDEEDVPDLPNQGRVLPIPSRPQPQAPQPQPGLAAPPPGSVQSQPLPPLPGTTVVPQTPPGGVANAPAAGAPAAPGTQPAGRLPKGAPPPTAATLQPGDEIVTEPPAQKIVNKKAVFSGLDKITGRIINFDVDVGETVQFGALRVKPDACYTRPSTEATNTDAFVEVEEITLQGEVKKIFSGWMFAASPGLHGVEHPIYDVWLTDCKGPDQTVATQVDTPAPPPKPAPVAPPKRQTQRQPVQGAPGTAVAPPQPAPQPVQPRPQPAPPPPQSSGGFFNPFRQ